MVDRCGQLHKPSLTNGTAFLTRIYPPLTEPAFVGCGARASQLPGVLSSFSENNAFSLEVTACCVMGALESTPAGWFSGISPSCQIKDPHMSLSSLRSPRSLPALISLLFTQE